MASQPPLRQPSQLLDLEGITASAAAEACSQEPSTSTPTPTSSRSSKRKRDEADDALEAQLKNLGQHQQPVNDADAPAAAAGQRPPSEPFIMYLGHTLRNLTDGQFDQVRLKFSAILHEMSLLDQRPAQPAQLQHQQQQHPDQLQPPPQFHLVYLQQQPYHQDQPGPSRRSQDSMGMLSHLLDESADLVNLSSSLFSQQLNTPPTLPRPTPTLMMPPTTTPPPRPAPETALASTPGSTRERTYTVMMTVQKQQPSPDSDSDYTPQ